jgi:hypothetical protein
MLYLELQNVLRAHFKKAESSEKDGNTSTQKRSIATSSTVDIGPLRRDLPPLRVLELGAVRNAVPETCRRV